MDFRLFGAGGPPKAFLEDLRALLSLDEHQLAILSQWVNDSPNLSPTTWSELGELPSGIQRTSQQTNRVVYAVRFVLSNWSAKKLTIEDISRDLKLAGFDEGECEQARKFFATVSEAKEKAHRNVLRRIYEQMALPTIDDINITWDLRPIFEDVPYKENPEANGYDNLLGNVYLLLLEISASRADGKPESQTYQFTEDEFERLLVALNRAKRQLEVFKKRVL